MDAAREMESLLSASLSQEQELSREMQRKYRELQVLLFISFTFVKILKDLIGMLALVFYF